jgi:Txe/YoeB family toxin of Txe-Axe toxin-antitoxin module
MKENKEKKDKKKFQDVLDTINKNPFGYLLKPLDNVKDFPDKVAVGLEKFLESPFKGDNKPE